MLHVSSLFLLAAGAIATAPTDAQGPAPAAAPSRPTRINRAIGLLETASYMMHPAGEHHFDAAKDEEVILQLVGYGPSGTTRLRPQDGLYGHSTTR